MFRGLLCFVRERQAATFKGELSVQMVPSKSFVTANVPFTLTRAGPAHRNRSPAGFRGLP